MLEQRRIAGHERRRGEADDLPEREVPRHHREDDAERLVRDVALLRRRLHDLGGEEPLRVLGEELAAQGALLDLGLGLGDRLAHLERHEARVAIASFAQQRRETVHRHGTFGERARAPRDERVLRAGDRVLDLLSCVRVERAQDLVGRWIDARDLRRRYCHGLFPHLFANGFTGFRICTSTPLAAFLKRSPSASTPTPG